MAIKVVVRHQDALEKALRILRDKCKQAQIFTIMQKKEHYISPSERRHKKKIRHAHR
jgi:ribosomal protein S21